MLDFSATYTDQYQLAMSQVYFKKGQKDHTAIFDYYFRKLPYNGGYAIFAGLQDLLKIIENLKFNDKDLEYLKKQDFDDDFLQYLKDFKYLLLILYRNSEFGSGRGRGFSHTAYFAGRSRYY